MRHGRGIAWMRGKVEALLRFSEMRRAASEGGDLAAVIAESDREIYRLQSKTGFDTYWKLYFRLAGVAK